MPLVDSQRNAIADNQATRLVYMSLHTAAPGTTGASEASGGSYARQPVTWNPAASGTATANQVTFDVPAGTYTHGGYWDAATGGAFLGGNALGASQALAAAGQIKVTGSVPVTAS